MEIPTDNKYHQQRSIGQLSSKRAHYFITGVTSAHYFSFFFIPSRLKFLRMTVFDSRDFSSPFDDAERAGTAGVCLHLNTFVLEAEK